MYQTVSSERADLRQETPNHPPPGEAACAKYPDLFFLLMAAMVFMLSNASCERGFSKQNDIMGSRSTRVETETLSVRMRISFDVPTLSFDAADALVATITEDYWSGFTAMPARAAGAAACHTVRREKGAAAAVENRKAKEARIGGS